MYFGGECPLVRKVMVKGLRFFLSLLLSGGIRFDVNECYDKTFWQM